MPNLMDRLLRKASPTARVFVYSTIMAMAAMVFGFDTGTCMHPPPRLRTFSLAAEFAS